MMLREIEKQLDEHQQVMSLVLQTLAAPIETLARELSETLRRGNKILIMGNGGSAADAQHFAAEIIGRFLLDRRALPAIALTTDTSILTAVGNDFGFDQVFSRQVEGLAVDGDLVIGISTSGHSRNVSLALNQAHERGCRTAALLGRDGGEIEGLVDIALTVSAEHTPRIQEAHLTILHILCSLVESELFAD